MNDGGLNGHWAIRAVDEASGNEAGTAQIEEARDCSDSNGGSEITGRLASAVPGNISGSFKSGQLKPYPKVREVCLGF